MARLPAQLPGAEREDDRTCSFWLALPFTGLYSCRRSLQRPGKRSRDSTVSLVCREPGRRAGGRNAGMAVDGLLVIRELSCWNYVSVSPSIRAIWPPYMETRRSLAASCCLYALAQCMTVETRRGGAVCIIRRAVAELCGLPACRFAGVGLLVRRPSCTFGVSRPQATRSNRQGTRARLKPLVRMWHEWRAHDEPAGVITRCRCTRQTDRRQAPDRHRVLGPLR